MAELPDTIGKYKIVSLVAKGGMGAVFKAVHPTLKRYVIIKKLTIRGNASVIERFKREAQILIDCNDTHIVHLYDYFKEGSSHYIVLEYVDGMSLDVLIKKRRYLSGELALLIFLDACKGLKYAHENGIIHRDIKPGNILISKTGDVKLADFGIASTEEDDDSGLTKEGMTLGTPSYMSPEQFENTKNVDKRADVYSMGIMLYEMVTGKKPFPGNFAPDTILMIQKGRYVRARKLNPDLPKIVSKLIEKMVQPNPRKRFQDMGKIIKIIEKHLKRFKVDLIHACLVDCLTVSNFEEPIFKPRKKKRVVFITILFLLALISGSAYYAWSNGYVHRYLLPDAYGAIQISVRIPTALKAPSDLFLKASLYENDRKDFPLADTAPIIFKPETEVTGNFSSNFRSNEIFAKSGLYRLKLIIEQRIYWYSFTVASISELKEKKLETNEISISFDDVPVRSLDVRAEAFDALTGKNITSATSYMVFDDGAWILLSAILPERLVSGIIHKFRAESSGYYPEVFSLRITPFQDELRLRANLIPLPGKLSVKTKAQRLTLRFNGSKKFVKGGEALIKDSLEGYRGGDKTWDLPAGRYELEVDSGNNTARTTVSVVPGAEVKIVIKNDNGNLTIEKESSNQPQ